MTTAQTATKTRLASCPMASMTCQLLPSIMPAARISAVQGSAPANVSSTNFFPSTCAKPAGREMKVRTTGSMRLKNTALSP